MPRIDFLNVRKAYGDQVIVPDFSLAIEHGSFTVVLGPSGCGKSTVLRMLAGLERLTSGQISIGGREVQDLEPSRRGCAMVFQNYALYPHMSVADNIGYGMKLAGMPKAARQARIAEVAASLGLTDLLQRRPGQLSGGQRQRVAIGRAIARDPKVFLFDEPLSNLDTQLRGDMRVELAAIHRRVGATSLFVTHDQVEAMTLADQIVVMNRGRIEQVGTPAEVYRRPASVFVAQFVGSPAMNLFAADARDGLVTLRSPADGRGVAIGRVSTSDGLLQIGLRPEAVHIVGQGIGATVLGVERHGREIVYHLDTAFGRVVSAQPEREAPAAAGSAVRIALDFSGALAFDTAGALRRDFMPHPVSVGDAGTRSTSNPATQ